MDCALTPNPPQMHTPRRPRGVHSSRRYGYTHHDAHAALLSASMRRLSKRLRPCSGRQAALRSRRASRCVPDRPAPFVTLARVGIAGYVRVSTACAPRPRHGTVRRDTDLRVGSRSRSTRVSRASFLATMPGCRAPGAVFRVFARSRRGASVWCVVLARAAPFTTACSLAPRPRPRASFFVFSSRTVWGRHGLELVGTPAFIGRARATGRDRAQSRSTRDCRASFFAAAAVARASVAVFRVFSRIVRSRSFVPPRPGTPRLLVSSLRLQRPAPSRSRHRPAQPMSPARFLSCQWLLPSGTASIRPRAHVSSGRFDRPADVSGMFARGVVPDGSKCRGDLAVRVTGLDQAARDREIAFRVRWASGRALRGQGDRFGPIARLELALERPVLGEPVRRSTAKRRERKELVGTLQGRLAVRGPRDPPERRPPGRFRVGGANPRRRLPRKSLPGVC